MKKTRIESSWNDENAYWRNPLSTLLTKLYSSYVKALTYFFILKIADKTRL